MHTLFVAFSAPPKNSPEAIQTSRFLRSFSNTDCLTLITTPATAGWARKNPALAAEFDSFPRIELRLPFHKAAYRVLGNRRLSALHVPDAEFWAPGRVRLLNRRLSAPVDVIYSRSGPLSGAVLAERLARRLRRPWLMHLSDPWANSPYRVMGARQAAKDRALEARCVATADRISMTTAGQVAFMQARYPQHADKFFVSPNMMGGEIGAPKAPAPGTPLHLVHTGSFYLGRKPEPLLEAIECVAAKRPDLIGQLAVSFYGNATEETARRVARTPACQWMGPVSLDEALAAQRAADVLVTIEAAGTDPLIAHFMPSKNLDYVAAQRPILAVTPDGSETARLCASGYGWAFSAKETQPIADRLISLIESKRRGDCPLDLPDSAESPYRAARVTAEIVAVLRALSSDRRSE